jgi:glycerol-3-phosphate O-acyltransferase
MGPEVSLPFWLLLLLVILAGWAVLDHLLIPSVRWYLRSRINRVIDELRSHLNIRIDPLKLTKRDVLIDRLLYDPVVLEAASAHSEEHGLPREVVMAKVERYAREIVPGFNAYFYFRIGYWLARRVAELIYRVRLGFVDEEGLTRIDPKSTVVFVMNHRSNMDYILVAYLAASRTALSYAVGEWARIWPLQNLIRAMGAYFVRRRSRNPLYRQVLARYVHMATTGGVTQAMYPEGGLSRDGLLGPPKLGLLDYMLRSFDPSGERDLVFIPIGINYDRVFEDRSLLLDLQPEARKKSAWRAFATTCGFIARNLGQMTLGRWYRFGYVCVNFGSPISMKEYLATAGLDPARLDREERFELVEKVAEKLMGALALIIPVVPVSLVATALLRSNGRMISELELKVATHKLMQELEQRGIRLYVPRCDHDYCITVGLRMLQLRHIVNEENGLYQIAPGEEQILSYYAGSIAHYW